MIIRRGSPGNPFLPGAPPFWQTRSIHESLGERHSAAQAEGFARHLEAGGGLLALPLVEVHPAGHPADGFFLVTAGDDVPGGHGLFDVQMQDFIEQFIREARPGPAGPASTRRSRWHFHRQRLRQKRIDKPVTKWHHVGMEHAIEEPRKRITARVSDSVRVTLEQAAELLGSTVNQFVVQTAYQEAQRVVERESVIRLSQKDAPDGAFPVRQSAQTQQASQGRGKSVQRHGACVKSNCWRSLTTGTDSTAGVNRSICFSSKPRGNTRSVGISRTFVLVDAGCIRSKAHRGIFLPQSLSDKI